MLLGRHPEHSLAIKNTCTVMAGKSNKPLNGGFDLVEGWVFNGFQSSLSDSTWHANAPNLRQTAGLHLSSEMSVKTLSA